MPQLEKERLAPARNGRALVEAWCARIPAITMRNRFLARLLVTSTVLGVFAWPADGALITFDTRAAFNAGAPGLPVESFESRFASGGVLFCPGPLMKGQECPMTPETVLPPPPLPSGLLAGITYSSESSILVLVGRGFLIRPDFLSLGNSSNVLGPYSGLDTLDVTLESASAIGLDVFPGVATGDVVISVFDSANAPMGTFTVLASPGGTFFGVLSDSGLIGRINVGAPGEYPGGLVDDVAFGVPIAEPATILLIGTGLAGLGRIRRRWTRSYLIAASVIARPRSMIATPSRNSASVMHRGGFVKK